MKQGDVRLYFFGDSICLGQFVSPHQTWTVRISKEVSFDGICSVTTQIAAVNGDTSRDALGRLSFSVTNHSPDIVWVQFGLNDANYWETDRGMARVSPQSFVANLNEIIDKLLLCGTQRVLVATNHKISKIPLHMSTKQYIENAHSYNRLIRDVVAKYARDVRVRLVDIEKLIEDQICDSARILLDDGVHLNNFGHELYFKQVIPILRSVILEIS